MRRALSANLAPYDPEIERTLHRRLKLNRQTRLFTKIMEGEQVDQNIQRSLRDYAAPTVGGIQTGILQPAIQANNFEIKPALIQMAQANQFWGSSMDDPNDHVTNFLQIC